MQFDTISESDFLLTELRYTVGQVRAQILDMEGADRPVSEATRGCLNSILESMSHDELAFQQRCSELVKPSRSGDRRPVRPALAPLERESTAQQPFEARREQTIAILREASRDWSDELMDLLKNQVRSDRKHTTAIAESWRAGYDDFPPSGQEHSSPSTS